MSFRTGAALLLSAALCLAVSPPLTATLLVALDLDELVARADVIAIGRVAASYTRLSDGRRAETLVTMGALTFLKGEPADSVEFRVPGGRVGRYRTMVPGAPAPRQGDEIVVFLRQAQPGGLHLVGFSQGLVSVARDPATREAMVMAPAAGDQQSGRLVRGDPARRPVTLGAFARRVQAIVERDRSARESRLAGVPDRGKTAGARK